MPTARSSTTLARPARLGKTSALPCLVTSRGDVSVCWYEVFMPKFLETLRFFKKKCCTFRSMSLTPGEMTPPAVLPARRRQRVGGTLSSPTREHVSCTPLASRQRMSATGVSPRKRNVTRGARVRTKDQNMCLACFEQAGNKDFFASSRYLQSLGGREGKLCGGNKRD